MKIQDLMVRRVRTIAAEDHLARAAREMASAGCGCLVVTDTYGSPIGIVTDRDICMAAFRANAPLSALRVRGAMSRKLFTCRPEDSLEQAEHLMGMHQVRRLPVVDEQGRLQGLITLDDLALEARREAPELVRAVTPEDVGRTLGQIGRPRLVEAGA